jgi:hypothetical protein
MIRRKLLVLTAISIIVLVPAAVAGAQEAAKRSHPARFLAVSVPSGTSDQAVASAGSASDESPYSGSLFPGWLVPAFLTTAFFFGFAAISDRSAKARAR